MTSQSLWPLVRFKIQRVIEAGETMKRALQLKRAGEWHADAIDEVVLGADERHRRRVMMTGEGGTRFLLDLPQATILRDGDGLLLDDSSIVRVVGKPEPLLEITAAATPYELTRLAWHIGNRHAELQVGPDWLRIRDDPVLADMLAGLGAQVRRIEAPFEPERGAYTGHDHEH
jgi:urease accessory protein